MDYLRTTLHNLANPRYYLDLVQNADYYWVSKHLIGATVVFSAIGLGLIYQYQGLMIYQPEFPEGSRRRIDKPSKYSMTFDDVVIRSGDGVRIGAYLIKRSSDEETRKAPTLIYFHANAGNMGHRLPLAEVFSRILKCNILMVSYRGYGFSEGTPDEKGMKLDSQAALDYVLNHELLKNNKIILYGQSIGGAVAIHLASQNEDKIHGLIVENTFLSMPKLIPNVIPFLSSVTFLCHQVWDSETSIQSVKHTPTLFLSGAIDSLIPPVQMKQLFEKLPSTNKKLVSIENGDHNDTCIKPGYVQSIESFWVEHIAKV